MTFQRLALLSLTLLILPAVGNAHEQLVADPDDSDGRMDIESVAVSHPRQGVLRFDLSFFEPHGFTPSDDGSKDNLRIDIRTGRSSEHDVYILLQGNPDGGLYGEVYGNSGSFGFARAWVPASDHISVEVARRQLRRDRLAPRADWTISTTYVEEGCGDPGNVLNLCHDEVPTQKHRL